MANEINDINFQQDFSYESDDVVNVGYAQKFREQINENFERIFTESEKLRREVANDIGEIKTDDEGKVISFQNQIGDTKVDSKDNVISLQDQIGQTTMDENDKVVSLQSQISGNGNVIRTTSDDKVVSLQEQIGETQGAKDGVVYSLQAQLGTTMGTAEHPISVHNQLGNVTYVDKNDITKGVYSIQNQIGETYINNGNLITLQSQLGKTKIKSGSNEPYSLQEQVASNNITKTKADGSLISLQDQIGDTKVDSKDNVISLQDQIGQTTLRSDNYTPYSLQDQLGINLVIDNLDNKDNIIPIRDQIGNITTYTSIENIEGVDDEEDETIVSKKVVSLQDQIGVVTDSNKDGNPNNSFKNLQEQIGEVIGTGNKNDKNFYSLQSQIGIIKENEGQTDVYSLQDQINDLKNYTDQLVEDLPEPMLFKGSLGIGGTIEELPEASIENEGYTYKVITIGTYDGQDANLGDLFISNGEEWILIPSGDEPSGTVTSIKLKGKDVIEVDDETAITESGIRIISHKTSGVVAGEYNKNEKANLELGDKFKVANVKIDEFGHVTDATDFEMTLPTTVTTQEQGDNSEKITNTAYVDKAKKDLQNQIGDTTGKEDLQTQITNIINSGGTGGRILGNRNYLSETDPKEAGEDVQERDLWFEILPDEDEE